MQQQIRSLYVGIPEVPMPVLPGAALCGKNWFETHAYGQDAKWVVVIDDSRLINKVAYSLKDARPSYKSLLNYGMNQKLLEGNKVSEEFLQKTFEKFDEDIWGGYAIWAELMDSLPERRGHKLPKGKNVALYRGAKVSGGTVNASDIEPVFLTLPKDSATITEDWRNALGAGADTSYHSADLGYSKRNLNGLNVLLYNFGVCRMPLMDSYRGPGVRISDGGSLLGSRLSANELVENLQPIKAEPKPKISDYQVKLHKLESDLVELKEVYQSKIKNIEESISNLKKLKPE